MEEDPTKTFKPGKKITLFDKSKQKYTIGALLIKTDESTSKELTNQEETIPEETIPEETTTKTKINQENSPIQSPKVFTWIQMLSIIITQVVWIYLLFIHEITWSIFSLIKQKINQYQNLNF